MASAVIARNSGMACEQPANKGAQSRDSGAWVRDVVNPPGFIRKLFFAWNADVFAEEHAFRRLVHTKKKMILKGQK